MREFTFLINTQISFSSDVLFGWKWFIFDDNNVLINLIILTYIFYIILLCTKGDTWLLSCEIFKNIYYNRYLWYVKCGSLENLQGRVIYLSEYYCLRQLMYSIKKSYALEWSISKVTWQLTRRVRYKFIWSVKDR